MGGAVAAISTIGSDDCLKARFERIEIVAHSIPKDQLIHSVVRMNYSIACANDGPEVGNGSSQIWIQIGGLFQGLTENFKFSLNSGLQNLIAEVVIQNNTRGESLNRLDRLQCIRQTFQDLRIHYFQA